MVKKILLAAIFVAVIAALLTACSSKNELDDTVTVSEEMVSLDTSETMVFAQIPTNYSGELNGVAFNMTVDFPNDLTQITAATSERQQPGSVEKITSLFDKEIVEEERHEGADANGETYDSYSGTFADDSTISIGTTLMYSTPFFHKIQNAFFDENGDYLAYKYSEERNFDFMSAVDAFRECMTFLNSCGYEVADVEYSYYALDYETMQENETISDAAGNVLDEHSEWDSSDNCYYFFAEQTLQGIPIYFGDSIFPDDLKTSRPIQILYSADGIRRLDVWKFYTFEEAEKTLALAPFDDVLGCVASKYGDILTEANYEVKRAVLYWMPQSDGEEMRLVWLFETEESGIDSETNLEFSNSLYAFVDATTAKEVTLQ